MASLRSLALVLSSASAFVVPAPPPRGTARGSALRAQAGPPAPLELTEWLADEPAAEVLCALAAACARVSDSVRTASCDSFSCFNALGEASEGEDQFAVDLLAEEALLDAAARTGAVATASSKTDQVLRTLPGGGGGAPAARYSVALDALDASSILDSNFAVGSIFSVFEAPTLLNVTGRQLAAAGTCSYGPRTAITLALSGRDDAHEFLLAGGRWVKSNQYGGGLAEGGLFAPANLRATRSNEKYGALVQQWLEGGFQLRYTGSLVPDVTQLLVKGSGVFASAPAAGEPPGLRLLYEAVPLAFLVEKAGGASTNGARSLLDVEVTSTGARTQVALGSKGEVARFDETVGPGER